MTFLTRAGLVLLRLVIAWHLLFEGTVKVRSHAVGKTPTNAPFTSAPYLRESTGPLADFFKEQAGDLDKAALERLTPLPLAADLDPARTPDHLRVSPALAKDWEDHLRRWIAYYDADDEQQQLARILLDQSQERAGRWLLGLPQKPAVGPPRQDVVEGEKDVPKSFGGVTANVKQTPPERIAAYRKKLAQIDEIQKQVLQEFGRDIYKKSLRDYKAEAARMRTDLLADLNGLFTRPLDDLLWTSQKAKGPLPEAGVPEPRDWLPESWPASLGVARGLLPPVADSPPVHWVDWLVRLGLVGTGLCLLLGLFTRTNCVLAAALLVLFTLSLPALPELPENLRAEGFYLYVNKNIIEIVALLTLATTASGRWVGLDGLLYVLKPSRWRAKPRPAPSVNGAAGTRRVPEPV